MIIKPKSRGFICTTAHPTGCAEQVKRQIEYVKSQPPVEGPKKVLVIGSSTGYGLASRIVAAFGSGASTVGVSSSKAAEGNRTANAGWYNTAAFEQEAQKAGLTSFSVIGDAFADETKQRTIDVIKNELGQVDLVVYSIASPRRIHPKTEEVLNSVIKPIGQVYSNKTVNFHNGVVTEAVIEPATEDEIRQTVAVMGGEDWKMWIDALQSAGALAEGATTVAYSYVGPEITHAVYRDGTIGTAKNDLEKTANMLNEQLSAGGGRAYVSVNKALVTQSSSAIPVVPLYISVLFKIMKELGTHEGCIEQSYRLFADRLYVDGDTPVDENRLIRIDDLEMKPEVQAKVAQLWSEVTSENIYELSDLVGYRKDFFGLFGFELDNVDYEADVDPNVEILHKR